MLRLQALPAGCGDCLWLEYGTLPDTRLVLIDGGLREHAAPLLRRLEVAREARGSATLEIELLVVTHIDNDHILGMLELLAKRPAWLTIKDLWFNGRPHLLGLPARVAATAADAPRGGPGDLLGGDDQDPADLLGTAEGDALSTLLGGSGLPWNASAPWHGGAVRLPEAGPLPSFELQDGLRLTLLGPTLERLHRLRGKWLAVRSGRDATDPAVAAGPGDLLGRRDTWPPAWKDGEQRDPSVANGSSIMLLAEYAGRSLLLAGDGFADDLGAALTRLAGERGLGAARLPVDAWKLSHHGSDKNLSRALIGQVDCRRFIVSTDGSVHRHPDHQALLRILRHAARPTELWFNCEAATTRPWRDAKQEVLDPALAGVELADYVTRFPQRAEDGAVLDF